jgi:hypothetical protein
MVAMQPMDFEEFIHKFSAILGVTERRMRPMRIAEFRGRLSSVIESALEEIPDTAFNLCVVPIRGSVALKNGKKLRFEIVAKSIESDDQVLKG